MKVKLSKYAKMSGVSVRTLKKVVGKFNYNPIEVCSTPTVITVKFN